MAGSEGRRDDAGAAAAATPPPPPAAAHRRPAARGALLRDVAADARGHEALEIEQHALRALARQRRSGEPPVATMASPPACRRRRAAPRADADRRRREAARGRAEAAAHARAAGRHAHAARCRRHGRPQSCRRAPPAPEAGAPRALDEALEVDLGHHALADQEGVGVLVGLDDHVDQVLLHHVLHLGPDARGVRPAASHWSTSSLASASGRSTSLASSSLVAFEVLDAQPQVVEFEAGLVLDHQGQARRQDACSRPPRRRSARGATASWTRGAAGCAAGQRLAPGRLRQLHPARPLRAGRRRSRRGCSCISRALPVWPASAASRSRIAWAIGAITPSVAATKRSRVSRASCREEAWDR